MELNQWDDDLIWCPSQCYRLTQIPNGQKVILYLRWRWDDPWQAHIIYSDRKYDSGAAWSDDLFEINNLHFEQYDYENAKEKVVEIFKGIYPEVEKLDPAV